MTNERLTRKKKILDVIDKCLVEKAQIKSWEREVCRDYRERLEEGLELTQNQILYLGRIFSSSNQAPPSQ